MEDALLFEIIFFVTLLLAGVAYELWAARRLFRRWNIEWERQPLRFEAARWGTSRRQREVERLLALRPPAPRR